MTNAVVTKAKCILEGIEVDLDITKNWSNDHFDNYYLYFSHPDIEVQKYSLLVFAAGLGNWYLGSAHIFRPIKELKKDPDFNKDKVYHFEKYIKSFLDNRVAIKREFPLLYNCLVWYLLRLDNEKRFEYIFRTVDKQLFITLREVLLESGVNPNEFQNNYNDVLREVGITPFFR
ncbi:hypothetical protein LYSIN_02206 [Lysinibacillus sphaericus]|uniref:Uncharacterized protein n=1 Tax=Lysinibacillus sphaericus TaxID=1421 RepID=A0A2S5D376_LYSSH|nr:hypothetical protein [Lysinibacillus sphaericus]POZ57422.1 hypothetical protein LYSIN_02206 [Lysinibacillus sphaericus]